VTPRWPINLRRVTKTPVVVSVLLLGAGAALFALTLKLTPPESAPLVEAAATTVAALFSGLALIGVVLTVRLQQRDALLQRFESTFVRLLTFQRDLVGSMRAQFAGPSSIEYTGNGAFEWAAIELSSRFALRFSPEPSADEFRALADDPFKQVCYRPEAEFGHYLRSLYHVTRYLRDSDLREPWPYAQLLRSQLSNGQQTVLFFYGLTSDGQGMKAYIEQYHLLRGVRLRPEVEHLKSLYQPRAFGATARTVLEEPPEVAA